MTSNERAALNVPRSSSVSSQMAAITAAQDREDISMSSPAGSTKGKLDQIKQEDTSMDVKQEDSESCGGSHMISEGGKGIKSEMKSEIKSEPMDENDIKEEQPVKDEATTPDNSVDIKPTPTSLEMIPAGGDKKPRRCSK